MFGTVTEWFYRWLGGIQPDENYPGFERFYIRPNTPDGLNFVNCSYNSPYGRIVSNWKKKDRDNQEYEIEVPEGTLATVVIPLESKQKIKASKISGQLSESVSPGEPGNTFLLKPGKYLISARMSN
jgi:alpha-L-rhamnosidase